MFTRDSQDRRRPERLTAGFVASLIFHALLAALLFSVATSSSQESSPESISGSTVVTVSREQPQRAVPAPAPTVAAPVPHTPVIAKRSAGRPRVAAARPYQRHELSKFAPTAPPNPTPVPASTLAPNPIPTQAVLASSPAPFEPAAPTSAPAQVVAVAPRVPPTAAPPKPTQAPTAAPTRAPQPQPKPSAATATAAPIVAVATPRPVATAGGTPQPNKVANPAPSASPHPLSAPPGPKPHASEGPNGQAPSKPVAPARPVQVVPTPRANPPAAATIPSHGKPTLNERLKSLIPTASPSPSASRAPGKRYSFLNGLVPTPEPEPTPPPQVIAATKFIYEENVAKQRWKQSILGTAPEEHYVKMYVTSVRHLGFVTMCKGWVVRAPIAGNQHWIVEADEEFICSGHLEPFTQPSPEPPKGS